MMSSLVVSLLLLFGSWPSIPRAQGEPVPTNEPGIGGGGISANPSRWTISSSNAKQSSSTISPDVKISGSANLGQDKTYEIFSDIDPPPTSAESLAFAFVSKSGEVEAENEIPSTTELTPLDSTWETDEDAGFETGESSSSALNEGSHENLAELLEQFINSRSDRAVITQAFRFVKLDSHLETLTHQLARLQESHEEQLKRSIKQETKFEVLVEQMSTLTSSLMNETLRLRERELKIEAETGTMNHRLETVIEKIVSSSVASQMTLELEKESLLQMDKVEGLSTTVLTELKSVKSELRDVGQATVQTIYNVQKAEESLMRAVAEAGNRTVYAMRQADLAETLLPDPRPEDGKVLLGNGRLGNSIQADAALPLHPINEKKRTFSSPDDLCSSNKRLKNNRPRDCSEVQLLGYRNNGIFKIYPFSNSMAQRGVEVYCELESGGGGWTLIQRRGDQAAGPRENFYRNWADYEAGFGPPYNHFWLGLSTLAALTSSGEQELRVELTDWEGNTRQANYRYFRVSNSSDKYRLHVTDFEGNAGDSLGFQNGMPFSTKDQDNDLEKNLNCAQKYHGGWWYKNCHQANLNGLYMEGRGGQHDKYATGIIWYSWHGYYYSLKKVEMKIRNRNFNKT